MHLETSTYYALGIPLYGLLMLTEAWLGQRRGKRVYRVADDLGNLACGMGQILAGLALGPLMLALYAYGYELRLFTLPARSPLTWLVSALLVDLCYYFYHRSGHRLRVLWAVHQVHHQSDGFNFAVALRQPYVSDLYAAFFYFPLPLLGVPLDVFFACVAVLSLNQVTLHTRFFSRPSLGVFNTPQLHELHHAKNAPYADMNFGATFIVWDRIFGTYVAPDPAVTPVLGIAEGYATHDSVRAQWLGIRDIARDVRRAASVRDVWRALFGSPRAEATTERARASDTIPRATKSGALVAFVLVTAAASALLLCQVRLSALWLAAAALAFVFAYHRIGAALDSERRSLRRFVPFVALLAPVLASAGCASSSSGSGGGGSDDAGGSGGGDGGGFEKVDAGAQPVAPTSNANPDGHCNAPTPGIAEDVSKPTTVVGDGTYASCTADKVVLAVNAGGVVTFNCGPLTLTIVVPEIQIMNDGGKGDGSVTIDGGGKITLSGNGANRVLYQNTCDMALHYTTPHCQNQPAPHLVLQNIGIASGKSNATDSVLGGGAVFVGGGTFKMFNVLVKDSTQPNLKQDYAGGAVYTFNQATQPVYITNSTFRGNTGCNGGALGGIGTSYAITNSIFASNKTLGSGQNPAKSGTPGGGLGGAIYNDGNGYTLSICGTAFTGNTAAELGSGAIFQVVDDLKGALVIDQSKFTANSNAGSVQSAAHPSIYVEAADKQGNAGVTIATTTFN